VILEKRGHMKLKRQIIITSILVLFLGFSGLSQVVAELGPITVSTSPSRANEILAFKIFITISKKIEANHWIKIWFPVKEASCNSDDVCGDAFKIKGEKENPRFVPSDSYFSKYKNSKEKMVGKLYEVVDNETGDTVFLDNDLCRDKDDECNGISSSSRDGYWLMGTVFPALPRDKEECKERLAQILHTISIGYSPLTECQYYPIIKQTCDERSIQINSPIEEWIKDYNPVDLNTSKATGILAPATPGRYRLRVATQAEPTPVESEAFFLSCSRISKPILKLINPENGDSSYYKISFNVGEGGAIDARHSRYFLDFPDCITISPDIKTNDIRVNQKNGTVSISKFHFFSEKNRLSLLAPRDVSRNGPVKIRINSRVLDNSCDEPFTVFVSTSSEPEMIESTLLNEPLENKKLSEINSLIKKLRFTSQIAGKKTGISFILDARKLTVNKYTEFRITLPEGSYIPKNIQNGQFLINNLSVCKLERQNNNSISLWMNTKRFIDQYSLRFIRFDLTEYARIQNPIDIGGYQFSVSIDGQIPVKSNYYEITKR
jgi:hypothetical protein